MVLQDFRAVYLCIMSNRGGQQLERTYFEVPFLGINILNAPINFEGETLQTAFIS